MVADLEHRTQAPGTPAVDEGRVSAVRAREQLDERRGLAVRLD